MTMINIPTAPTQDPRGDPHTYVSGSEREQENYWVFPLVPDRNDVPRPQEGDADWLAVNWFGTKWAQPVRDYLAHHPPLESDKGFGIRVSPSETEQTSPFDVDVGIFFGGTGFPDHRLRYLINRLGGSYPTATVVFENANVIESEYSENRSSAIALLRATTFAPAEHRVVIRRQPQEAIVDAERLRRLFKMEATLRGFSELPRGWDSHGGLAISFDAIYEARTILRTAINLNLPEPWIAPGGDAGVGIQWDTAQAELYIDVVPAEETTYVLTPKAGYGGEADGVLTTENLISVLTQLAEPAI